MIVVYAALAWPISATEQPSLTTRSPTWATGVSRTNPCSHQLPGCVRESLGTPGAWTLEVYLGGRFEICDRLTDRGGHWGRGPGDPGCDHARLVGAGADGGTHRADEGQGHEGAHPPRLSLRTRYPGMAGASAQAHYELLCTSTGCGPATGCPGRCAPRRRWVR